MCLQLMNQTDAMVTEKNSPGLNSTFTNAAVRAKSSSMASRLPRIRTDSGMLLRSGQRTSGGHQEQMGRGGRGGGSWSDEVGAGKERSRRCPGPLGLSPHEGWGWFSPLIQEGVEERKEQQRQLGQQCHPVVEVESVCGTGVVGARGRLGAAVGPC